MSFYDRIENDFVYHPPKDDSIQKFKSIRDEARALAHLIDALTPDGREKALALTYLEQTVTWANAGIVRYQDEEPF